MVHLSQLNSTTENRFSMPRSFPGIALTTVVATSVILSISLSRGRRKMQRKREVGRQLCVDSRGKKRGGWFIALAGLHSASRSRRTNLGTVLILNSSTRASYVSSTQKSRTRERGSGVFSNLRERARMHGNQILIVWFAGQRVRVYVWRKKKEDLAIVYSWSFSGCSFSQSFLSQWSIRQLRECLAFYVALFLLLKK